MTSAGPASAAPPVTTYGELSAAFAGGGTVVLGADIAVSGEVLAVAAGESVTLDLDGYSLSVTDVPAGKAGIGVPAGTALTIKDTGRGGELTATGGAGGAGIGGGAGSAGVSSYHQTSRAAEGASGAAGTVTGGNGGSGGSVAGRAPVATGGDGAQGGAGALAAGGGNGGAGGASTTTGTGGLAVGGSGASGGQGGVGGPGGDGGPGGAAVSVSGVGVGGSGGDGGIGGTGAGGGTGGDTGSVTILGGTIIATGGVGGAGIGGGVGGAGDDGGNGGNGGVGGAGTGAGGTGVGGLGGAGGNGGTGGAGGDGGAGGTITVLVADVTASGGTGADDIGGGAGAPGGPGGTSGNDGADGASSRSAPRSAGETGPAGNVGASGTVFYGPGAPTSVSASPGSGSATVSFTAPASSGTSPITGYTVTATDVTDVGRGGQQAAGSGSPITVDGLTPGDVYTFTVEATNSVGTGAPSEPSSAVTINHEFTSGAHATISGTARVGQILSADAGDVSPAPDSLTYRWFAGATRISGAESPSFIPTAAQQGKVIRVRVTAVKDGYSTSTDTSEATDPVAWQAAALLVTDPRGPELVGRRVTITTLGLEAGEKYTIRFAGSRVAAGTAASSEALRTQVTVPSRAHDGRAAIVVTGSESDRRGRTSTRVFTAKTLGSQIKKENVSANHLQRVTITDLAARERVTIKYRGARISPDDAHATRAGVYSLAFQVGEKRGITTVKATGRFRVRTATETFRVSR